MPCPYANVLGVAKEGFHAQRIGGFALNDILGTLALAGITSQVARVDFFRATIAWFVAAEVIHFAFGVRTAFLEHLNLTRDCDSKDNDHVSRTAGKGAGG